MGPVPDPTVHTPNLCHQNKQTKRYILTQRSTGTHIVSYWYIMLRRLIRNANNIMPCYNTSYNNVHLAQ